jgi:Na+/H+-dicarboxylate symporter
MLTGANFAALVWRDAPYHGYPHLPGLPRPALVLIGMKALFWATILFTFVCAEMPATQAPHLFPWDKAEHFVAFYVLTSLAAAAYPRSSLTIIALWLALFGAAIELVQAIPAIHRDCDIMDWVADVSAVAAALAPVLLARWRGFDWSARDWVSPSP